MLIKKQEAVDAEHRTISNYQSYVDESVASYIANLKKGENNIAEDLHLVDETKANSVKDIIDDTAENQIISVHHKIPMASAVPLYLSQHTDLHPTQQMQEMFAELAGICPQAVENRSPADIATIGFAMNIFAEECRKDNITQIYKISDKKKREQALQVLKNKDVIRELYQKYFLPNTYDRAKIRTEILNIVNNPSNHTLPIGNVVHQKMEPNGHGIISKIKELLYINVQNTSRLGITTTDKINNSTIFAAEYERAKYEKVVKKLNSTYRDALNQYNKGNEKNIVSRVSLALPETGFMQSMRTLLNIAQRVAPIQYLRKAIGLSK